MSHPRPDEINRYFSDNADYTYRLNYPLDSDSLVIDLGGYLGNYAFQLYQKYNCNIYVFEPIKSFYDQIFNKFLNINKVKVFNFGLGPVDEEIEISVNGDASSIFENGGNKEKINIKNVNNFFTDYQIKKVNLLKVNIEGAEYDLLEDMISNNLHVLCDDMQIQFHPQFDPYNRREKIQNIFSKTHYLTYNYEYVFENWRKK